VKDDAHLLATDAQYRAKAERIAAMTQDLSEVIPLDALPAGQGRGRVAFHCPCTLQHGQQIRGKVEALLQRVGYELTPVRDAHLCCGSAGTYSLLQPEIANELRGRKLAALEEGAPQGRPAGDRHGEHRLPGASPAAHRDAGAALDRAGRRSAGVESDAWVKSHQRSFGWPARTTVRTPAQCW
jgi:glycolate oxidase iron-sulfur subunit